MEQDITIFDERNGNHKIIADNLAVYVGEFCKLVLKTDLMKMEHQPAKSWIERVVGPDAWYKGEFQKDDLSIVMLEYANGFAIDDFLDSVKVTYNDRDVYSANMHRNDITIHRNQLFFNDTGWLYKIMELKKDLDKYVKV